MCWNSFSFSLLGNKICSFNQDDALSFLGAFKNWKSLTKGWYIPLKPEIWKNLVKPDLSGYNH